MYSEIGFIFDPLMGTFNNIENTGSIYQRTIKVKRRKSVNSSSSSPDTTANVSTNAAAAINTDGTQKQVANGTTAEDAILTYKGVKGADIKNSIKQYVYSVTDDSSQDPYISLINHFNDKLNKALMLRAADFAYLKDLGVYPINRLWILRRFPDNTIVPNNLLSWGKSVEPISTVVGWLKHKEDSNLFSISFGETWVDQTQMLDKLINEMMKNEFGFKTEMLVPVPGWSQGILFGILNGMGLSSDYDSTNVPTGDPNVLRISKMREIQSESLKSNLEITLETSYEQKYINGVDPGMAMLDVMGNLYKMGTSDHKFVLGNSAALQQLIGNIQENKGGEAWINLAKNLVASFIEGVTSFVKNLTAEGKPNVGVTPTTNTGTTTLLGSVDTALTSNISNAMTNVGNILIAGTISKYRWPLKGSIALMSGINTTPWHLTVGNPFAPIINVGNILVTDVGIKFSNDFGFNDMPASINVTIKADMSRPMGKSELERMFNNGYKRVYASGEKTSSVSNVGKFDNEQISTPSGTGASNNIAASSKPLESNAVSANPKTSVPSGSPVSSVPAGMVVGPGGIMDPVGSSYNDMIKRRMVISNEKLNSMSESEKIKMLQEYDIEKGNGKWKP